MKVILNIGLKVENNYLWINVQPFFIFLQQSHTSPGFF